MEKLSKLLNTPEFRLDNIVFNEEKESSMPDH